MSNKKLFQSLLQKANHAKKIGDKEEAISLFHSLYKEQATVETAFNLAVLYKKSGDVELAQKWAEAAEHDLHNGKSISALPIEEQNKRIDAFIASLDDTPETTEQLIKSQQACAYLYKDLD